MTEFLLIAGMALVTFGIRYPVLALLGRIEISASLMRALRFVPVAVLCALSAPMVFISEGDWFLSLQNPALTGSLVAGLIAWRTKHLLLTIAIGMLVFVVMRLFAGTA